MATLTTSSIVDTRVLLQQLGMSRASPFMGGITPACAGAIAHASHDSTAHRDQPLRLLTAACTIHDRLILNIQSTSAIVQADHHGLLEYWSASTRAACKVDRDMGLVE